MGKLVLAGALSGLGKGVESELANSRAEAKERRMAERETALRKMEQEFQSGESAKNREFQGGQQEKGFQHTEKMATEQESGVTSRQKSQLDAQASQGQLDRTSREKIAGMRADAALKAAKSKTKKSPWVAKMTTSNGFDPESRLPVTTSMNSVFNSKTARTYIQHGDKFLSQGVDVKSLPEITVSPKVYRQHVQKLLDDPTLADKFESVYGFLPVAFISSQTQDVVTSEKQSSSAHNPGFEDDEEE